jgi:hypothetical protein
MIYDRQKKKKASYLQTAKARGWDDDFIEYLRADYEFTKQAHKALKRGEITRLVMPRFIEGLFTPEQDAELLRLWKRIPPEFLASRQRRFFRGEAQ